VSEDSIEFRTNAVDSRWNAASLLDAFYHGLSGCIKEELAVRDRPAGLDELVAISIRIDSRLRERRKERDFPAARPIPLHQAAYPRRVPSERGFGGPVDIPEPMQLGWTRLSTAKRQRHLQQNLCLYCGQSGHFVTWG